MLSYSTIESFPYLPRLQNLKKKDVEQEREIQMLAKRKSELKKKYDVEFNKCTEEQHQAAEVILQVIRSKSGTGPIPSQAVAARVEAEEEDGHTSDSTTTASGKLIECVTVWLWC